MPLSSFAVKIKDGLGALGLDSVFDIRLRGTWVSLFDSPDVVALAEISAHEEQLGQECEYSKQNLYHGTTVRTF